VPLGLFLSGGIDSSGLAVLMASVVREPIRTFSVGFSEPGDNELAYARLAARSVGAEHREVVVSPEEFFHALPHLLWHEDEPIAFPSSVPLYFVSRLARDHVKVVLTGEGADELFLGYNRYRVTVWNQRLGRVYRGLTPGALREGLGRLVGTLPRPLRRYAQRTFLALPPGPRGLFYENFAVFPEGLQQDLLLDRRLLADRDPYAEGLGYYLETAGRALERSGRPLGRLGAGQRGTPSGAHRQRLGPAALRRESRRGLVVPLEPALQRDGRPRRERRRFRQRLRPGHDAKPGQLWRGEPRGK